MPNGGGVVLLDDDEDLRAALGDLVQHLTNLPCLTLCNVAELVAHRDEVLGSGLAILDINLGPGQPSGLDAHAWLAKEGFRGRVAFLTGHARSHPLVARAATLGGVEVLQKPIGMAELRRLLALPSSHVPT
jgi:FixJ family two-component response regulator